ncbi:MAG: CheR family methyltransferase [Aquificaceae bacterium]|jgi:chemotaxis protein methyltransferase CheR|uniref:CheR family methyltransferase n=1 Tax=Hydrogenobacter sp. Uz 6-8 TaxID=3384828 RepID=UPI000F29F3D3|nr:MAG: protein-glutamate O-methyltransferase CheR [Aquificota bacterium]
MDFSEVLRLIEKRTGMMVSASRLTRLKRLYEKNRELFMKLESADVREDSWQRVIDAISVQETYFYRDGEVFECIKNSIFPEIFKRLMEDVKIWSAGCATGEEAYTIAMLAVEYLGMMGYRVQDIRGKLTVLGTDLSVNAIQTATKGVYKDTPMGSFRKSPSNLLKYFEVKEGGYYHVKEEIKRLVEFRFHNLMDEPPLRDADLVVCRNVLIYFSDEARERAYDNLTKAMKKGGFLVMGPLDNPDRGLERQVCERLIYFYKP